jgi:hypothetical protein
MYLHGSNNGIDAPTFASSNLFSLSRKVSHSKAQISGSLGCRIITMDTRTTPPAKSLQTETP